MEITSYKNEFVSVRFDEAKNGMRECIVFRDLTDRHNETSGFTKKIRGIKLAWKFISQLFNEETLKNDLNFRDIQKILDEKFNLNTHTYCAMD